MESLLLLKPDVYQRRLTKTILDRVMDAGLIIGKQYSAIPSAELVTTHYENSIRKHGPTIAHKLVSYFRSGPVHAAIIQGDDAVMRLRELSGPEACPIKCEPGTLRRDYGIDVLAQAIAEGRGVRNLVHSSDSPAEAQREIGLWFYRFLPPHLDAYIHGHPLLRR
jgi:nucleoside-diphosphate kinase